MNVLLVDDDANFRMLMRRLFEKKFFASVTEAENGIIGLEMVRKGGAHIVFLDYEMPHMNGRQFIEKLREIDKVIPVVVMTSHNEKDLVSDMIPFGISDYLIKADMSTNLLERIGQIFAKNKHYISRKL